MAHIELRNVPEALHQAAIELMAELAAHPDAGGHSFAVHGDRGQQIYGQVHGAGAPEPAPAAQAPESGQEPSKPAGEG